ncbi:polyprenyl synthetase family protein [Streptomyces sp. NPDC057638]|uniref:polyprenyl synthetase family protein n=1 Tax=Streptomyces sp. NPDC057638 TaxID=3346190 RepID=UPI0036BC6F1E
MTSTRIQPATTAPGRALGPDRGPGLDPGPHSALDPAAIRAAVDQRLQDFLDTKRRTAGDPLLASLTDHVRAFVMTGGKRVRPLLCVVGWHAAQGYGDMGPVITTAASLELFHAFALIHDDLMDGSDLRRGRPTVHRALAATHPGHDEPTPAERFGVNGAVLVGDLVMVWSDEMLHTSGLHHRQLAAVRPLLDAMRTEVMIGQYRDLLTTGRPTENLESALTVIRYKTAKYTVERPLHIGAAVAGADRHLLDTCTAYAIPIGEAFQLRDDLLGVFGDPRRTGKSTLDDLREGKATVLMAHALRRSTPRQAQTLRTLVGDPGLDEGGAAVVRELLRVTGAADRVEAMIRARVDLARQTLDEAAFPDEVKSLLDTFATTAALRTS